MRYTLLFVVVLGLAVSAGIGHVGVVEPTTAHSVSQPVYRQSPATVAAEDPHILSENDGVADITVLDDVASAMDSPADQMVVTAALADVPPVVLLPPVAYSRYDGSDPLANATREALYEYVQESPGTYVAEVASETDTPVSTVRYHLRVLREEGLVQMEHIRGKKRLFPSHTDESALRAALHDESTAQLVDAIRRHNRPTMSALADSVDKATSTVSYHVSRLESDGLVERQRRGEHVVVSLSPDASAQLAN